MNSKKIILASNNKNKLREIKEILTPLGYEVISQSEAGINIDIEETGKTFKDNAKLKASAIYSLSHTAVIADDSGLEVDYLNGAPGVYSHRYAGEGASDADRYNKLLSELKDVPEEKRGAAFVCVICFIDENGIEQYARGECRGKIGYEPRGENGFGYDPVFMYGDKSFAEISADEKNKVSHRAKALEKLCEILKTKG
ncbi:XTP/dITP diphosphatase [Porcipelethomonas sp.]|uniref:XTP/dITP diphosphatase n=1 Tax=Porcipelethomonas sp. TaxID=2981675 RepID=UPI003EF5FC35